MKASFRERSTNKSEASSASASYSVLLEQHFSERSALMRVQRKNKRCPFKGLRLVFHSNMLVVIRSSLVFLHKRTVYGYIMDASHTWSFHRWASMWCSFWVISNNGTMENAVASLCICLSLLRSGTAESRVCTHAWKWGTAENLPWLLHRSP